MGLKTFSLDIILYFSENISKCANSYRKYSTLVKVHPTHMRVQKIVDKRIVLSAIHSGGH